MGTNRDKVTDDLAKGKQVDYKKFKAQYAWATKEQRARLKELQPGFADRAENEGKG